MSKKDDENWSSIEGEPTPESSDGLKPTGDAQSVEKLKAELQEAQKIIEDYKDQSIRMQADMINQRQRVEREAAKSKQFALDGFAKELLPVIDSLERCVNNTQIDDNDNTVLKNMHQGMELTLVMLRKAAKKFGIEQLNPVGEKFNPEQHEAVSTHRDHKVQPNTVLEVLEKGYTLNGRLIRPAMVVVSS